MKFRRQDGTFGEFEPGLSCNSEPLTPGPFEVAHYRRDGERLSQTQLTVLTELGHDAVVGEGGAEVATAMVEWLEYIYQGPNEDARYPKEKI